MVRILVLLSALVPLIAVAAGDPEAGAEKAAVCASCHGMDGNSQVTIWPKLAGQHADYAARQSILIRDDRRNVPEMYPIVQGMSNQDLADIAAFYEQQSLASGVADESLAELGRSIYQAGNPESGVPACGACHGPAGNGIPGAGFPLLRAQHADYTAKRLRAYRSGEHNGEDDPYSQIMVAVSRNLSDEEIEAVSSYIQGLHMTRW